MKKIILGIVVVVIAIVGIGIWKGEDIVNAVFYDMDATMDLPDNLYDDESLTKAESTKEEEESDLYVANVRDYLSLREEPNGSSKVLEKLAPQTEMEILSRDTAPYVQVYVPSIEKEGYVHQDYITQKDS